MKFRAALVAMLALGAPVAAETTPPRITGLDPDRMQTWINSQFGWKETPKLYLASDPSTTRTGAFGLTHLDLDMLGYVDPQGRCDASCFSDREWKGQGWLQPEVLGSRIALGNSQEMQDYIAGQRTALNAALIDGHYHPFDEIGGAPITDAGALAAAETIGPMAFRSWANCGYTPECLHPTLVAGFATDAEGLQMLLLQRIQNGRDLGDPMIRSEAPPLEDAQ